MAAAGVLSDFEFGFTQPAAQFDVDPTTTNFTPPLRPDTPQLTLHAYHKFQHSPQLSSSPELDYKRVRRKASVANLAAGPESAPFAWTTNCAPPAFFNSFAPHDLVSSFLPPPPSTPLARQNASPSLSSTVTTLLSTPTHTPIVRGGAGYEEWRAIERSELTQPLQSKRKFPSLKQAKRLPRRVDSGSGDGDGGVWEIHAAILEPPQQEVNSEKAPKVTFRAVEAATQRRQQQEFEPPEGPVRLEREQIQNSVTPEHSEDSLDVREEKIPPGTSSFSLSKFEFPVPPGHDNWGGTLGHITAPSSPQSPATFHLHGASFDLVNPHASLLLGAPQFETPAEIDGLLDSYFDNPSEEDDMSYPRLPWSDSAQSLGAASDSSRHTTRLYDDAASARRYILRVEDEVPPPPKVFISESPRSFSSPRSPPLSGGPKTAPLPIRPGQTQETAGLFANMPSIGRVLGWNGKDAEEKSPRGLEEGTTTQYEAAPAASRASLTIAGASRLVRQLSRRKNRRNRESDPFDLTLSDDGFRGISLAGQRVEVEPTDQQEVDHVGSLAPDGDNTHASSPEQATDPTIREILNGYDYTRVEPASPLEDDQNSSPVERGRSTVRKSILATEGTPPELQSSPDVPLPTPPAPTYNGRLKVYSGCSELPTTDQTYGNTSQLLQVNQSSEVQYPPYREWSPCHPATCQAPGHDHTEENKGPQMTRVVAPLEQSTKAQDFGLSGHNNAILDRNLVRASSIYTMADDDADWETQVTESQPAFMQGARPFSMGSYADTSACGSKRLSCGPEALMVPPPAITSPRTEDDEQWARDHHIMFQLDDESQDVNKAISLLSDKFLNEGAADQLCGNKDHDKEQRMLNLLELERLRRRNPEAVRKASGQIAERGSDYYVKLLKTETESAPPKRNSFLKALQARGKNKAPNDPASDRRALLGGSPTPGDNNLQYDESLNTFVTVRDHSEGSQPGKQWWPHGKDPTIHALRSPSPLPYTGIDDSDRRRAGLDLGSSGRKFKRASRVFSGQSTPIPLKLLKPKNKTDAWKPLTDQELADRMPNWQVKPNLRAGGALANYAMREEVRREGPVYPRLPAHRFFPEDRNFNPAYTAERELISRTVLLQCCCFPPLTLAYALGYFDFIIQRKTSGRITKMAPKQKSDSMKCHLPLGCLAWAIVIVLIVTFVQWFKNYGGNSAPIQ